MSGASRARWFDPTNATYTDAAGGLVKSGSRSFTLPGKNSAGDNDWIWCLIAVWRAAANERTFRSSYEV